MAAVACTNDMPLETVGDRCEPLASDGMWTKRGPSHDHQPAIPRVSCRHALAWAHAWTGRPRCCALIASQLSNASLRPNAANGVTGYDRASLLGSGPYRP